MPKNIWQKSLVSHIWTFLIYIMRQKRVIIFYWSSQVRDVFVKPFQRKLSVLQNCYTWDDVHSPLVYGLWPVEKKQVQPRHYSTILWDCYLEQGVLPRALAKRFPEQRLFNPKSVITWRVWEQKLPWVTISLFYFYPWSLIWNRLVSPSSISFSREGCLSLEELICVQGIAFLRSSSVLVEIAQTQTSEKNFGPSRLFGSGSQKAHRGSLEREEREESQ